MRIMMFMAVFNFKKRQANTRRKLSRAPSKFRSGSLRLQRPENKKSNSNDSLKKLVKKIRVVLLVAVVLALGWGGVHGLVTYKKINSIKVVDPLDSVKAPNIKYSDDSGISKELFVFEGDNGVEFAALFITDQETSESMLIYIPRWVYISPYDSVIGADLPVSDLRYAGSVATEKRSMEFALWSMQYTLGMNFDSYVWFTPSATRAFKASVVDYDSFAGNSASFVNYDEDYDGESMTFITVARSFSKYKMLLDGKGTYEWASGVSSNKNLFEMIDSFAKISAQIDSGDVFLVDLSSDSYVSEETIDSGKLVKFVDIDAFDHTIMENIDYVRGREMEREQAKVEVYNGSGLPRQAERFARSVQNNGMLVTRYENAPSISQKTAVYVSDEDTYKTSLKSIEGLFLFDVDVVYGRPDFLTTGDIVIVLGEDISREVRWE